MAFVLVAVLPAGLASRPVQFKVICPSGADPWPFWVAGCTDNGATASPGAVTRLLVVMSTPPDPANAVAPARIVG